MQAIEYLRAGFFYNGNIYGATFFMYTGFHGFHVIIGTIFLIVCLVPRQRRPQFSPRHHLGFEFAALVRGTSSTSSGYPGSRENRGKDAASPSL